MKYLMLLAAVLVCAGPVAADEILLTNGSTLHGIIRTDTRIPGKVVIEVASGTVVLSESDVSSIKEGPSPLHEYQERLEAITDSSSGGDYWSLAVWARGEKLTRYLRPLAMKVIEMDPEHAEARAQLRHEKIKGEWLTYEQAREAKGFIKVGGRWLTAAELERNEQRKIRVKERQLQARADRKERKKADREKKAKALKEFQEWVANESKLPYGYMHRPSWFWPAYYRPYSWNPYKHKLPPNGRDDYHGSTYNHDLFHLVRGVYWRGW